MVFPHKEIYMKCGVADFGMNKWDGGCFDIRQRLTDLKAIGFEGTERLEAVTEAEAMHRAAEYRRLGMDFALCRASVIQNTIEWTASLGKDYVWVTVAAGDLDTYCRQANIQSRASLRYGVRTAVHNHLGKTVESQEQLDEFLKCCPDCGLVFDTAHLHGAGGDCLKTVEKYFDRIVAIHLKDWTYLDREKSPKEWQSRLRFCELGSGEMGDLNARILKTAIKKGYNRWVFVEQDTHLQYPIEDLKISRDYIYRAGL